MTQLPDCYCPPAASLVSKTNPRFGGGEGIFWSHPPISLHSYTASTPTPQGLLRKTLPMSGNRLEAAAHPPNCSVILLISLFKSLSVFRAPSIFSTECSTVVWCLPPNCRPISGSEASVRRFARYMAICRG